MKLSDLIHRFVQAGIESPRANAEALARHVLQCTRAELLLKEELLDMEELVQRRLNHEPVDYIIGSKEFFGSTLEITPDVLIPRPETEYMIELIAKKDWSGARILDLCCGSGAIGIALKRLFPTAEVTCSDVSQPALEVARRNGARVVHSFFLNDVGGPYDLVVCNPPYVTEREWRQLQPEVRDWEPKSALVAPEEGMYFYRLLAENRPAAHLWLEYAPQRPVAHLFEAVGYQCAQHCDLAGRGCFLEATLL